VADEASHELYLVNFTRDASTRELILDQDRQFNDFEQIEAQILPEVRVVAYAFGMNPEMLRDIGTDSAATHPRSASRIR
jgi:hypothetical protein